MMSAKKHAMIFFVVALVAGLLLWGFSPAQLWFAN